MEVDGYIILIDWLLVGDDHYIHDPWLSNTQLSAGDHELAKKQCSTTFINQVITLQPSIHYIQLLNHHLPTIPNPPTLANINQPYRLTLTNPNPP